MQAIGPIGKLQDLNLRDGDFVVCVDGWVPPVNAAQYLSGRVYKYQKGVTGEGGLVVRSSSSSTFQRLHHHDPRCFGFEEKTRGGHDVEIFVKNADGLIVGGVNGVSPEDWQSNGVWFDADSSAYDLIPLTPPTEFEVLGHRFATRKEAEDAMEIKEVAK